MIIEGLMAGASLLFQPTIMLGVFVGVLIGMSFGVTPGLDATSGTALLVSATFVLPTEVALGSLLGLYTAATYAGSITAITIGVPGTPASAATVLDGFPMTKSGFLDKALSISIYASVVGGLLGTFMLIFLAIPLAEFALKFGAPEYFALGLLGVSIIASMVSGMFLSGFILATFGLIITTIGIDGFTGFPRFTFGNINLIEGVPYIPALVGLFAVTEALLLISEKVNRNSVIHKPKFYAFSLKDGVLGKITKPILIGSLVGSVLGAIPAVGAAAANWIGYNEARRFSKEPDEYGKGSVEGLAAAESSNNSTVSTALVPLLAFGIPGSATAAVLLGAMMMHGVTPGPSLFVQETALIYFMFVALAMANVFMFGFGVFGVSFWVRLVQLPKPFIIVTILTLAMVGSFSVRSNVFDIYLAMGMGVFGYLLRKAGLSVVPIVLAIVLGALIEENFRRSLIASNSGGMVFFERPITAVILVITFFTFVTPLVRAYRIQRKKIQSVT